MTISTFFERIGAPLANIRWSWGGVRKDGAVVLRVWQNETVRRDGGLWVQLTHHEVFKNDQSNYGYVERNRHVDLIRNGAACYMVMCEAEDLSKEPRVIKSFNNRELFKGDELAQLNGDVWIKVSARERI